MGTFLPFTLYVPRQHTQRSRRNLSCCVSFECGKTELLHHCSRTKGFKHTGRWRKKSWEKPWEQLITISKGEVLSCMESSLSVNTKKHFTWSPAEHEWWLSRMTKALWVAQSMGWKRALREENVQHFHATSFRTIKKSSPLPREMHLIANVLWDYATTPKQATKVCGGKLCSETCVLSHFPL